MYRPVSPDNNEPMAESVILSPSQSQRWLIDLFINEKVWRVIPIHCMHTSGLYVAYIFYPVVFWYKLKEVLNGCLCSNLLSNALLACFNLYWHKMCWWRCEVLIKCYLKIIFKGFIYLFFLTALRLNVKLWHVQYSCIWEAEFHFNIWTIFPGIEIYKLHR